MKVKIHRVNVPRGEELYLPDNAKIVSIKNWVRSSMIIGDIVTYYEQTPTNDEGES